MATYAAAAPVVSPMSTGYVMDFTNGTFAAFVETCIGFDPDQRHEGSKAVILRQISLNDPLVNVAKLNLDLLGKWKLNKVRAGEEPTKHERHALDALTALFTSAERPALTADDLAFVNKDLEAVDLTAMPKDLTAQRSSPPGSTRVTEHLTQAHR